MSEIEVNVLTDVSDGEPALEAVDLPREGAVRGPTVDWITHSDEAFGGNPHHRSRTRRNVGERAVEGHAHDDIGRVLSENSISPLALTK